MNEGCTGKIIGIVIYAIIGGVASYLAVTGLGVYVLVALVLFFVYSYVKKHYYRNKVVKVALDAFLKEFGIEKESVFHCSNLIGNSDAFHTQNGTFIAIDNEGTVAEFHTHYVMRKADYDEWLDRLHKDFEDLGDDAISNINFFYPKEGDEIIDDVSVYKLGYTIDTASAPDNLYAVLASFVKEHEPNTVIMTEMEVKESNNHYVLWFKNDSLTQCWCDRIDDEMKMKREWLDEKWWSLNFINYNKEAEKLQVKIISKNER